MASYEHKLTTPPTEGRAHELWLQNAAGFILYEDSRAYAIDRIDPKLDAKARAAVVKGIDDALYGLMMISDGVSGTLSNDSDSLSLRVCVLHVHRSAEGEEELVKAFDLFEGDGMCMGIQGWRDGDFGKHPPAASRPKRAARGKKSTAKRTSAASTTKRASATTTSSTTKRASATTTKRASASATKRKAAPTAKKKPARRK